jgi:D,D-heptose 1,7-bisphosphate phosphatase
MKRNLSTTKTKAVFLDRDGVINEDVNYLSNMADFRLLPSVPEAIRELKSKGYLTIVITNQAAIAKGILTIKELEAMHVEIETELASRGAIIDAIYYCPHHPEGIIKKYAVSCNCRKPGIGMIEKAIEEFNIDPEISFLVGDKTGDILAGERAGLTTVLVRTGYGGRDGVYNIKPDFTASDLGVALEYIS